MDFPDDVVVVGGCGHVGLPLGVAFASRLLRTTVYDLNADACALVNAGQLPFAEPGADEPLRVALDASLLHASSDPASVSRAEHVVVVIGTPVDEHLNPDANAVPKAVGELIPYLRAGQILILRSTLFPGVTASVERLLQRAGLAVDVAFCPERIAEGRAMVELFSLPQIVAARDDATRARAARLFRALTSTIVDLEPEEAELAKLFTNAWRYIRFAAANQLYMMANDFDLDYERIRQALSYDYPRAADLPSAGFAAGPCLFKDTMQLAAFNDNKFLLGHSAMMINEGMPLYVVSRVKERYPDLASKTVGILGMAFKGDSDDTRSSLAFKLRRILKFSAGDVVCADDNVCGDPRLVSEAELLKKAEIVIIAAPHSRYRDLSFDVPVIDIWALRGEGGKV